MTSIHDVPSPSSLERDMPVGTPSLIFQLPFDSLDSDLSWYFEPLWDTTLRPPEKLSDATTMPAPTFAVPQDSVGDYLGSTPPQALCPAIISIEPTDKEEEENEADKPDVSSSKG